MTSTTAASKTVAASKTTSAMAVGRSPLLSRLGAVAEEGSSIAWHYGDPLREQRASLRGAGIVIDGWARGTVQVRGADRLTWLQSLASQDFLSLADGDETQALWLSPQGHVQHFAYVRLVGDGNDGAVELGTETVAAAAALTEFLASRQFRAAVEVEDRSAEVAPLILLGPDGTSQVSVPRSAFGATAAEILARGAVPAGTWAHDALRIAARTPQFGTDNDDRTLPHEMPTWLAAAVSLTKGCYCGQETVARIENIGAPPRRLVLLNLDGSGGILPRPGDTVTLADERNAGKVVGRLGTVAQHWEDGPVALALVKRTVAPGVPLVAGDVDALIDPDDQVPSGPKIVYDRSKFIDLKRR
ncbi:MAG: folate-binding protein [Nakamurella sp.]